MTTTTCTNANANEMSMGTNEIVGYAEDEREIVPDGLYERLLELAETKSSKKMTKRKLPHAKKGKSKTHKQIKKK
jgi:hypothetical protein